MDHYQNDMRRRSQLNQVFIDAPKILRYLIGSDEKLETHIICNPHKHCFVTTDQEVYHALGAVKEYDNFRLNKLAKFFEAVSIRTVAKKQLLTEEIVDTLRHDALRKE
ncbi:hypothetical protein ACFL3V_03455 [Nanoarchaeota archaeon]